MRLLYVLIISFLLPSFAIAGLYGQSGKPYGTATSGSIYGQSVGSGETELNTSNEYGQDCILMYLFDTGTGPSVKDYSGSSNNATLSGDIWTAEGVLFDDPTDSCSVASPTLGAEWSILLIFESESSSGSWYAQFYNADNDLQMYRDDSDTIIAFKTNNGVAFATNPATDLWDTNPFVIVVTYDSVADLVSYYVNGALEDTDSQSFGIPTLPATFYIGNGNAGSEEIDGTISAFYMWDKELDLVDVQSLYANPYQMFNNPPTRTFTGGGDTTPPEVATASFDTTDSTITFTESVDLSGYDADDFEYTCSVSGTVSLTYSSGSGSTYYFTHAAIGEGETCTLGYPVGNVNPDDIEDGAGNDLATFSGQSATNNTGAPTVVAVSINQLGTRATVEHSEIVVTSGYDNGDYELDCTVTGNDIDLNNISGSGTTREFDIDGIIVNTDVCTLKYVADVSADDIEDIYGIDLGTFSGQAVTNNVPVNPPGDTDYHYFSESGSGDFSGVDASNRFSMAQLNNAAYWDTDVDNDGKIGPGDTLYGDGGTITSDLIIQQAGTASYPIVIDGYEAGSRAERSNSCTSITTFEGVIYGESTPYITIRDFCFDNPDDHNIDIARGDGYKAKGVKILNSYFVGKDSGYGSVVLGFTPDAEVSGNRYYYAGSTDGRKFVSLAAGTNVKIINNQTDGGTLGIYIRPNMDYNYNGTLDAPAGTSHTIDPEYNLDGLEIAYNYTVRREEEGHSIDSPASNPMFPLVEVLEVTGVSGTSITVDNTGGEWTGEGDVWSGLYLTSMRDVDGSFGIRSIIASQSDNVFTTTEDISSHISVGDYVTVGMGAKNVWAHHNFLEDYGYGNSTYLAEDIVYRSLWENNKTEPTTQVGGMGLKILSTSHGGRRSTYAHTSDTVRCNSTWNLVRYNLFGDLLGQVYRVSDGAAYVAHRVFSAINNDFHPNNAANGYQDRGINLTRATAYKSGNTNEVSDLGYLGSFLGSDTWSAAVATEIYANQPPAILTAVLDTSANPDEVAITFTESVTGQLGLTWVKDGGSETMTCSGSGATRTCTIPDGTSGSNYYITYDADTGNIEDTGGTEMHTFGLPGHWNISGS
jgi:hypothetical protein